jgi:DNA-binding response OmpR family regulator
MRILLVEDETKMAKALARGLEREQDWGWQLLTGW